MLATPPHTHLCVCVNIQHVYKWIQDNEINLNCESQLVHATVAHALFSLEVKDTHTGVGQLIGAVLLCKWINKRLSGLAFVLVGRSVCRSCVCSVRWSGYKDNQRLNGVSNTRVASAMRMKVILFLVATTRFGMSGEANWKLQTTLWLNCDQCNQDNTLPVKGKRDKRKTNATTKLGKQIREEERGNLGSERRSHISLLLTIYQRN